MSDPFRRGMLQEFADDFRLPAAAMLASALEYRATVEQHGLDARPTASAWYRLFGLVPAVNEPLRRWEAIGVRLTDLAGLPDSEVRPAVVFLWGAAHALGAVLDDLATTEEACAMLTRIFRRAALDVTGPSSHFPHQE